MLSFARTRAWHEWKVKQLAFREFARKENFRRYNRQRGFIINPYVFGGGGDPYFANVVSLVHFDDLANTYTDIITSPSRTWTRYGTTTTSSATQVKYGAGALEINNTGAGGITTANDTWQNTGTSDFCYEWWCYLNSYTNNDGNQGFHVSRYNGSQGLVLQVQTDGKPNFLNNAGSLGYDVNITGGSAIGTGAWHHLAYVRDGPDHYGYADGVSFGTDTGQTSTVSNSSNPLDIGGSYIASSLNVNGFIDDFRFTIGVPRYPGGTTFTPPAAAHPDS